MTTHRGSWASEAGFILAAVGSAVGLGNMWRFSATASESGGAAFVVLYVLLTIGHGRAHRPSMLQWRRTSPGFRGAPSAGDQRRRAQRARGLEEIGGYESGRIRSPFGEHGFLIQEWDKVRTDWVTIRGSAEPAPLTGP